MKLATLPLLLLATLLLACQRAEARDWDYCLSYDTDPYLLMGTKTAYQFVRGRNRIPSVPNCSPAQVWVLSRHGTRYPSAEAIKQLLTLSKLRDQIVYNHEVRGNGRLCDPDLTKLRQWLPNPGMAGAEADTLTQQGEEDMQLLARRLQSAFPELLRPAPQNINFENYRFRSTETQRTLASMEAFMNGLFGSKTAVPAENTYGNDSMLRPNKNCQSWESSIINDNVEFERQKFMNGPEYQNLVQNVSRRLGFSYQINNGSIQLMYDMCRWDKAWIVDRMSAWCTVFTREELRVLEYLEDLYYFYYSGPGRDINARLGCPLLQNMFTHFNNVERGTYNVNEPRGIFYFAHSVAVQTFLAALGIGRDYAPLLAGNYRVMDRRSFRTSIMSSFSANLVAIFYKCSDTRAPNKVMFYLDETPVLMDGCSVGLCDWEFLKSRFGRQAEQCSLEFCWNPNSADSLMNVKSLVLMVVVSVATVVRSL